jgi:ABC-type antimicrobial peptide transport system permease subunit
MFLHYIKIALRNLRKYALQNTICILGLAVGFVAFSLSAYWYWFDSTYDKQYKDWKRMFAVSGTLTMNQVYTPVNKIALSIIANDPQVEMVGTANLFLANWMSLDDNFVKMFGIRAVAGDFEQTKENGVAISESVAKELFGNTDPIGRLLTVGQYNRILTNVTMAGDDDDESGMRVVAVFSDINHSFLKVSRNANNKIFRIKNPLDDIGFTPTEWSDEYATDAFQFQDGSMGFVKVRKGVDLDKFVAYFHDKYKLNLTNVSKLHLKNIKGPMDIRHIRIFMLISLLLILCAVVNCITLTVSRITGRRKEMGLRLSCGSSFRKLLQMMCVELAVMFLIALSIAIVVILWVKDPFSEYTLIGGLPVRILWGCAAVMAVIFALSMIAGVISMTYMLKGSLSAVMTKGTSRNRRFRITGLTVQLTISLFCILFTAVIIHQLNFVRSEFWGIGTNGVAVLDVGSDDDIYWTKVNYMELPDWDEEVRIKQEIAQTREQYLNRLRTELNALPMVNECRFLNYSLVSNQYSQGYSIKLSPDDTFKVSITELPIDNVGNNAYGFKVIAGSLPDVIGTDEIVISENVCRKLGLEDPLGKTVYHAERKGFSQTIVAVIEDVYLDGPLSDPIPLVVNNMQEHWMGLYRRGEYNGNHGMTVSINPDMRKEFSTALDSLLKDAPLNVKCSYMDDWLSEFIKPADNLLKIMMILAVACMLIAVSGVYMVVTLSCQERRREIAIRKVHGAKIAEISYILLKEYGVALAVASALAFSTGTIALRPWLQQFAKTAPVSWWIYASALMGMALLILLTVGHRVIVTSRTNPADVVKSE